MNAVIQTVMSEQCAMQAGNIIVARYRYDAFGRPYAYTSTGATAPLTIQDNRFLFQGREWLNPVRLNDHRNRLYSPDLNRWVNRDPIAERGGVNVFNFVNNGASRWADPLGLVLSVDPSCHGHEDLLKGYAYLAEREPGNPEPDKQFRKLPDPGQAVSVDAIYRPDGTATKIPNTKTITLVCICVDKKWVFREDRSGIDILFFDDEFKEWQLGKTPPSDWPSGDGTRPKGPYTHSPYNGRPPGQIQEPLDPWTPGETGGP